MREDINLLPSRFFNNLYIQLPPTYLSIKMSEEKIATLSGTDGNVFALLGRTGRYLDKANRQDLRKRLYAEVNNLKSYDEALSFMVKLLEEAGYDVA